MSTQSDMESPVEYDVPSTSPWLLRATKFLIFFLFPFIAVALLLDSDSSASARIFGAVIGYGLLLYSLYLLNHQMRNPDRLILDDTGFTYTFLNLTFRVGWQDVQEISLEKGKEIRVRFFSPERVAYKALVRRTPLHRTQYNPYSWITLRRFARLKSVWPKDDADLARFLKEAGEHLGFHSGIPVLESAEKAEHIFNDMRERHARWRPTYTPHSVTSDRESSPEARLHSDLPEPEDQEPARRPERERQL